jgi:hypothetical protein
MNARGPAAVLALTLLATAPLRAETSETERRFLWQEANAVATAAATPVDYLRAAQSYQRLVDLGVRNDTVLYNLGTALLLGQQYEPALQALRSAERYGGARPDVARNLSIALARRDGSDAPVIPWTRYVLLWHYALPCATRLLLAAVGFAGLWLAAALTVLGRRQAARHLLVLALLALVVFGTSAATTLHHEDEGRRSAALAPAL